MNYGWLGVQEIAHQRIGFFVDEDNRILYWRNKRAPGYVLDFETADQLLSFLHSSKRMEKTFSILLISLMICLSILHEDIYPYVSDYFSLDGNYFLSLTLIGLVPLMGAYSIIQRFFDHILFPEVYVMLQNGQQINVPRPKPYYLKRSEYLKGDARSLYVWDAGVIAMGLALILYTLMNYAPWLIGDVLTHCFLGGAMIWWSANVMITRQYWGLMVKDIRLYSLPPGKSWTTL